LVVAFDISAPYSGLLNRTQHLRNELISANQNRGHRRFTSRG
jgi:hypothetical protein